MKTTELIIKLTACIIWIIAGTSAFIPLEGTTLQSTWMMGFIFGLLFISISTWMATNILSFLCSKSTKINAYVEKHWGNPEHLKDNN